MFTFKSLFRFLAVWFGVIAILSVSPVSAAEKPEIFVQLGHPSVISALAVSPDGKYLASADTNVGGKNIKIWDMLSGREFRTIILGGFEMINYLKFSVDAKQIFAVSSTKIYVFDVYSGNNTKIIDVGHLPNFRDIFWVRERIDGILSDYGFSVSKHIALYVSSYDYPDYPKEIKVDNFIYTLFRKGKEGSDYILEVRRMSDRVKVLQIELNSLTFFVAIHEDVIFTPDLKHLITAHDDGTISIWDLKTGQKVRGLGKIKPTGFMALSYPFSLDNRFLYNLNFADEESQVVWDIKSGRRLYYIQKGETVPEEYSSFIKKNFDATKDGKIKVSSMYSESSDQKFKAIIDWSRDHTIRIYEKTTNKEIAQFISFTDGEWIVITPGGYYNSSANGDKHLNVRIGNNVYGIENYREAFFRPDLVKVALSGGSLKDFKTLADVKQPPVVLIVNTPESVNKDEATVTLNIVDSGGGIGDIRLYLNGSAVILDSSRGVKITHKDDKAVYKTYNLKLSNGINTIRAIAFNGDNTMQSNDVLHEIKASFKSLTKPSLNAVIVGINEYKNPKLQLKYAVSDAELFEDTLKKVTVGLFEKVNIKKLVTKENTTSENVIKELKSYKALNPDDVFVFFVASHGTVDDGEYFLITSNVGSTRTEKLKTDALTQGMLKELIANIPATKKLIIIDTCSAGALGEAIQVAMLTRGMSEDTAMKILSRAVGSTILSASTSLQEAVEGYKGHGLFTYVLVEGLKGKADKGKTGYVKTTELADYVDNEVPALAEKVFKRAQYPTISISGQGFPIGKTAK